MRTLLVILTLLSLSFYVYGVFEKHQNKAAFIKFV